MTSRPPLDVLLANPRSFCAGVERAIATVERAIADHGPPVYVRHQIVHNRHVVAALERQGAIFVEEVDEIPIGALTVFSAHGVSRKVEQDAGSRGLRVIDAICPLVAKVHHEGLAFVRMGYEIVLIGHRGHPEVEGTLGQVGGTVHVIAKAEDVAHLQPRNPDHLAYVTQTTLSVDDTRQIILALKARFPSIRAPNSDDICYATQNRQAAVRDLARRADLVLVVGSANSSNSNRLREIGEEAGRRSYLIEDADHLDPAWLRDVATLGLSAGASAPEILVEGLLARLSLWRDLKVKQLDGPRETVRFKLPNSVHV